MGKGDSRTKKGKRFMRSPRKYSQKKQLNTGKMENKSEYGIYEEFLKNFDSVNYKNKDSSTINNEFQKVISELCEKDMINVALQAELDRQVFLIRKSFEFQDDETKGTIKGLSWQMAGTQDMANGNKIPFIGLMLEILLKKISSSLSSVIKKRIISMQKPNMV